MLRRLLILATASVAVLGVSSTVLADEKPAEKAEKPGKEIKLGTLAPKNSAWGKVFDAWEKAVVDEGHGKMHLTWFYGGIKGDELAMVGKIRSKEIDGAAITATGLAQIWPHISVLQMPGLFPTWAKLDAARDKLGPKMATEFGQQGFVILGKGDVGAAHLMSRGREIRTPEDLKKAHPFYISGDPVGQKLLEIVGVPSPKALPVPGILPALAARGEGSIDVITTTSIAAEALGWSAHMDHVNDHTVGFGVGALVMNKETFDGLPEDARAVLKRTGENTGSLLTERIRKIDDKAFERLKSNKTVVTLNDTEKAAWGALFGKVRGAIKAEGKVRNDVLEDASH